MFIPQESPESQQPLLLLQQPELPVAPLLVPELLFWHWL